MRHPRFIRAFVTVAGAAALAFLSAAGLAHAQIVSPDLSTATSDHGEVHTFCPKGDFDTLVVRVQLLDTEGVPCAAVPVDSVEVVCPGMRGFSLNLPDHAKADAPTDAEGRTIITMKRAGNLQGNVCIDCGVTVHQGPETCVIPIDVIAGVTLTFLDMNGDGVVTAADFAVFAGYWLQGGEGIPADYDQSGGVNGVDFAAFAGHWLHDGRT